MANIFALVLALLCLLGVRADLPVHCLRHLVAGEWEFTIGPAGSGRSSCGHQHPDDPNNQPALSMLQTLGQSTTRRLTLSEPDTVTADSDGAPAGTWTMIYDEGFEVKTDDFVFFAFSGFSFVQGANGKQTNVSHCDQTQLGWYHNAARTQFGCYVGKKVGSSAQSSSPADHPAPPPQAAPKESLASLSTSISQGSSDSDNDAAEAVIESFTPADSSAADVAPMDIATPQEQYTPLVPTVGYDKQATTDWQQTVAEALNFLQLGWTAASYEQFSSKTPRELNKFAGARRAVRKAEHFAPKARRSLRKSPQEPLSFIGMESTEEQEGFDWRSKDGKNWLQPVVTQGDCGSCYTISTVHMLTARNKIRKGDTSEPQFSVSFPLYCSEYNQGCDGGYGFLQSKWNEDVGMVPESCAPFSQGGGSCQVESNCDLGSKRYRATNHHYVGGYYGGSTEQNIKEELVKSGPVVMSFEPKEDFMYYKNGVYRSGPNRIHQEWEQVDHAVLLVAFGSDSGASWTMQNSWGTDWGEDGYFRMARGGDESGCESIVVAADVTDEPQNAILDDFVNNL